MLFGFHRQNEEGRKEEVAATVLCYVCCFRILSPTHFSLILLLLLLLIFTTQATHSIIPSGIDRRCSSLSLFLFLSIDYKKKE